MALPIARSERVRPHALDSALTTLPEGMHPWDRSGTAGYDGSTSGRPGIAPRAQSGGVPEDLIIDPDSSRPRPPELVGLILAAAKGRICHMGTRAP